MSGSEIARLLQQIRDEEESAKRALHDPVSEGEHTQVSKTER